MKITAGVPKRLARKREEGKGGIGYRRDERRQPAERRASPDNGAAGPDAIGRDTAEGMLRRNAALCNVPMYGETVLPSASQTNQAPWDKRGANHVSYDLSL